MVLFPLLASVFAWRSQQSLSLPDDLIWVLALGECLAVVWGPHLPLLYSRVGREEPDPVSKLKRNHSVFLWRKATEEAPDLDSCQLFPCLTVCPEASHLTDSEHLVCPAFPVRPVSIKGCS